jgi:undecaprenyl-diphosphatase
MDFLISLDKHFFLFLNGLHYSWLDGFMWQVSTKTIWIPFYAVLIFFMIWKRKKYWWITILSIALMILLSDQGADLVKNTAKRHRPTHNVTIENQVHTLKGPNGKEYRGGEYGFVSSHASNSFAIAFFISLFFAKRWLTIFMFIWAAVICYSRIYLGVHYPLDILGGAMVGSAAGIIIFYLERFVYLKVSHQKG